jgi:RNA polymerase sigma-70 factor (ECF subfamily)
MEDKELVQLSLEGNEEAFSALVEKFRTKVFNMAYASTRDRDTADDLAQEIFVKTYFALPKFRFRAEFGTWLYRLSINHIRDHLRKTKRMKKVSLEDTQEIPSRSQEEAVTREEEQEKERKRKFVFQTMKTLPEKYQIILSLRDIQGFSYQEIAQALRISSGTVDSRLHRARKMLRKRVEPFLKKEGGSIEL